MLSEKYLHKLIRVKRTDGTERDVMIVNDESTDMYCFINLTTHHVCACRFNTLEEAFNDLVDNKKVASYTVFTESIQITI